ncbi:MAG: cytochrome b/b6 domain-containing protein [Pseudomonadota bacterium]|nr:cytochrome b/b6 domain-containing protein [Pseudomonadota bacterium]
MPHGYTRTQIALHWVIFILIAAQFLFNEAISDAWRAFMRTGEAGFNVLVAQHVFGGLLILGLVIWRLAIKLKRGGPPLPENEPAILKVAAHGTHILLYLLMILVPVSGAVAWFGGVETAAEGHEVLKSVLLILVLVHFLGAIAQRVIFKSDVMTRMMRPNP